MIVPMNLVYGTSVALHQLVFCLQLATFVGMACQLYGFTVTSLRTRKLLGLLQLGAMLHGRLFCFGLCVWRLHAAAVADGLPRWLIATAYPSIAAMSVMNAMFLAVAVAKLVKLLPRSSA